MSIVFIDGFDHYPTAQIGYKWDSLSSVSDGSLTIGSGYGRYGSQGLRVIDNGLVGKVIVAASKLTLGFAFRVNATMNVDQRVVAAFLSVGAYQIELRLTTSNQLQITRGGVAITGGTATGTLVAGVTYFCEFQAKFSPSISANDVTVRVGGVTVINLPAGSNTAATGATTANAIQVGHGPRGLFATNYSIDFDDLYLLDGLGTRNNTFIGDQRVEVIYPVAAGADTDFTATGAASAVAAVQETTADFDTSYIASNTPGDKSTFTFGTLATTPNTVAGLQMVFMARKDDAGTRVGAGIARIGGTDYVGPSFGVADAYTLCRSVFETNPATTVAWTPTEVNALEAGIKLVV